MTAILAASPRDLTRADIEAWCENPERGTLRISPQFLLELLGSAWHRPDGSVVRIVGVRQFADGEVAVVFHKVAHLHVHAVDGGSWVVKT